MLSRKLIELSNKYKISKYLIEEISEVFSELETIDIIKQEKKNLINLVRTNLLKIVRREAIHRLDEEGIIGFEFSGLSEAIEIRKGKDKVGNSLAYLNGEVMSQGYGSMLAVQALDPQPKEFILDMTAAPGGKSCFIGERMENQGLLIANDKSNTRLKSLISNLSRHGVLNTIVTKYDASQFPSNQFDRILLDAPCSGSGLLISDPYRRLSKTRLHSYQMQRVQMTLLRKAITLLKPKGIAVYSTCAFSVAENEEVISPFLDEIKLLHIDIPGKNAISDDDKGLKLARRLSPVENRCDGFFIAKFQKR